MALLSIPIDLCSTLGKRLHRMNFVSGVKLNNNEKK